MLLGAQGFCPWALFLLEPLFNPRYRLRKKKLNKGLVGDVPLRAYCANFIEKLRRQAGYIVDRIFKSEMDGDEVFFPRTRWALFYPILQGRINLFLTGDCFAIRPVKKARQNGSQRQKDQRTAHVTNHEALLQYIIFKTSGEEKKNNVLHAATMVQKAGPLFLADGFDSV